MDKETIPRLMAPISQSLIHVSGYIKSFYGPIMANETKGMTDSRYGKKETCSDDCITKSGLHHSLVRTHFPWLERFMSRLSLNRLLLRPEFLPALSWAIPVTA
jgi:hypothetical protein